MSKWKSRIVGQGEESPEHILANPFNFRNHPKIQREALAGALNELGWIQQVIINRTTGHLIDGHLRVDLALERREPAVPVVYVELTEAEEKIALATIDPISAMAEQDQAMLDRILEDIGTVGDDQLQAFLSSLHSLEDEPEEGNTDPDACPTPRAIHASQEGQVWILGDHRLMVADGTVQANVDRLCDGEAIDLVWTDPPYNVDDHGSDGKTIANDKMSDAKFREFLVALFTTACAVTKPGGPIYIAHADSEGYNFRGAMMEAGWDMKQCLIWRKNSMVLGRQDYQWQHEPILYGWKPGAAHAWYGEFNKKTIIDDAPDLKAMDKQELLNYARLLRNALNTSVIEEDKPARNEDHPTMKPVRLIVHMLKNSSRRGDTVLDLCGGSGSTLIAAEQLGRRARLMELDPVYADVIIRRWQEFTGRTAILESTSEPYQAPTGEPVEVEA